jgi:predicted negative regulator of RcsB-dependent stress response
MSEPSSPRQPEEPADGLPPDAQEFVQGPFDTEPQIEAPPPPGAGRAWVRPAAIAAAILLAVAGVVGYRSYHRQKVLRQGMARAQAMVRADTYTGYREASRLLEPLAKLDPVEAGALRAFALGMLHADYREPKTAEEADALLVEPGRAARVPDAAWAAYAALALGRQEAGNAATYSSRSSSPTALALRARTAIWAGNLSAAAEPLAQAVEADPTLPVALALRGDVLRRTGRPAEARRAYADALAASPRHPRAAFGLAKLALSGQADTADPRESLARLLDDREGTPRNERARAALYLAALQARAGDRAAAAAAVDKAGLDGGGRAWLERAVAELELNRGPYRVVGGAPAALLSASDDDPYVAPPPAAPAPRAEPAPRKAAAKAAVKKAAKPKGKAAKAKPKKKGAPVKGKAKKPAPKKKPAPRPPAD